MSMAEASAGFDDLPRRTEGLVPLRGLPPQREATGPRVTARRLVPKKVADGFLLRDFPVPPLAEALPSHIRIDNPAYRAAVLDALRAPRRLSIWEIDVPSLIDGRRGEVFIAGQLFSPTAAAGRRGPSNSPLRAAAASLRARNPALSVDRAITIRNSAESAYFHAFEDIVNRLHHAYEAGVAQDRSVIAPARYEGHTPGGQLLQAYDPSVEVIFQARRQPILARRLIVVDRIRYHAETWREIAARVRPEPPPFDVGSRIVLDRNQPGAARRDCQGYDRLADALVARGYVRLDPSVLSVGQQKFVFSRARHVVGVNGSAFTNMVFSEPGRARFDAIVPQHWATSTFACLSCALGHSFSGHLVASWGRRSRLTSGLDRETAQEILKNCML